MRSTERRAFPHRRGLIIVTTLATAYMASHFFRASNVTIGLDLMRDLEGSVASPASATRSSNIMETS